ncbi:CWF19-like protein 2 [Anopheles nili]|uniref:CWF19-like protein 2 n=1 Tax=Anopheles nili TaxID=185578 RepID=UPI00237A5041|nr:CWF19-like protein 2 [Anopheles nili]XP_053680544.1 CWF19-like protein 2 [Anopheles nili]XP_053680545.1 CWF19-like protein 2 [Anopheles nili]
MGSSSSDNEKEYKRKKHKKKEKKSHKTRKEKKLKKDKKHKRHRRYSTSSNSGSESDEWIEALPTTSQNMVNSAELAQKLPQKVQERDDWMNAMSIPTYTKEPKIKDSKNAVNDQYDPKTSVRELNPYWKNGGTGLPSFRKPANDNDFGDDEYKQSSFVSSRQQNQTTSGWKKSTKNVLESKQYDNSDQGKQTTKIVETETKSLNTDERQLTDEEMNALGAKIIKAELLGNTAQAESLKIQLKKAKEYRNDLHQKKVEGSLHERAQKRKPHSEDVVTYTYSKHASESKHDNQYKKHKRYEQSLPPGSDLSDKFRSERHENYEMDAQFFKVSSKMGEGKSLDNIFDHQKASTSTGDSGAIEERAIRDMNRMSKVQADCERCLESAKFGHDQLISMGKNVFLAVPAWRALQPKHCIIAPVGHFSSLTQVDEDVHREIVDVCKALIRMFTKHQMEVVFFETVRYLNRNPHMYIQCVPAKNYEMAPFYFKKAILESETEWCMNKKLHNVDGFNVRKTIPKGLPYFWVNFNMENGFAHVIEDQEAFPVTFATETIAGILGLDTKDWRKPRREINPKQKVDEFKKWWQEFESELDIK